MARGVILLLPPQCDVAEIGKTLARWKLTKFEEIEPMAGCRRFVLT